MQRTSVWHLATILTLVLTPLPGGRAEAAVVPFTGSLTIEILVDPIVLTAGGLSKPCLVSRAQRIFFGPHVGCSRRSPTIILSTPSGVRRATDFGARLRSSRPFTPPSA